MPVSDTPLISDAPICKTCTFSNYGTAVCNKSDNLEGPDLCPRDLSRDDLVWNDYLQSL